MRKKHFINLSNSVILFFEEAPELESLFFGVWDNHNDRPDCYIGEFKDYNVETYGSVDLLLDQLEADLN
jgi:hypothetical protein